MSPSVSVSLSEGSLSTISFDSLPPERKAYLSRVLQGQNKNVLRIIFDDIQGKDHSYEAIKRFIEKNPEWFANLKYRIELCYHLMLADEKILTDLKNQLLPNLGWGFNGDCVQNFSFLLREELSFRHRTSGGVNETIHSVPNELMPQNIPSSVWEKPLEDAQKVIQQVSRVADAVVVASPNLPRAPIYLAPIPTKSSFPLHEGFLQGDLVERIQYLFDLFYAHTGADSDNLPDGFIRLSWPENVHCTNPSEKGYTILQRLLQSIPLGETSSSPGLTSILLRFSLETSGMSSERGVAYRTFFLGTIREVMKSKKPSEPLISQNREIPSFLSPSVPLTTPTATLVGVEVSQWVSKIIIKPNVNTPELDINCEDMFLQVRETIVGYYSKFSEFKEVFTVQGNKWKNRYSSLAGRINRGESTITIYEVPKIKIPESVEVLTEIISAEFPTQKSLLLRLQELVGEEVDRTQQKKETTEKKVRQPKVRKLSPLGYPIVSHEELLSIIRSHASIEAIIRNPWRGLHLAYNWARFASEWNCGTYCSDEHFLERTIPEDLKTIATILRLSNTKASEFRKLLPGWEKESSKLGRNLGRGALSGDVNSSPEDIGKDKTVIQGFLKHAWRVQGKFLKEIGKVADQISASDLPKDVQTHLIGQIKTTLSETFASLGEALHITPVSNPQGKYSLVTITKKSRVHKSSSIVKDFLATRAHEEFLVDGKMISFVGILRSIATSRSFGADYEKHISSFNIVLKQMNLPVIPRKLAGLGYVLNKDKSLYIKKKDLLARYEIGTSPSASQVAQASRRKPRQEKWTESSVKKKSEVDVVKRVMADTLGIIESGTMTQEKENEIISRIRSWDTKAREWFVRSKRRFISDIARSMRGGVVEFDDLVQFWSIGLLEAINWYQADKGARFNTFASRRIRGAMQDAIRSEVGSLTNGSWAGRSTPKIRAAYDRIVQRGFGKQPTIKELMEETGFSEKKILNFLLAGYTHRLEDGGIRTYEEEASIYATIEAHWEHQYQDMISKILEVLKKIPLSDRQRFIIDRRYGLDWGDTLTLTEIWDILGVGESRVCQIHWVVLAKLRHYVNTEGVDCI